MLVYACADLIFATKISSTANELGLTNRPARDAEKLQARLDRIDDGKANEAVTAFMVDLDLGDQAIQLIQQAKQYDAGLTVIAFGSHVETHILHAAKQAGGDFVMPRSQFTANLPNLIGMIQEKSS